MTSNPHITSGGKTSTSAAPTRTRTLTCTISRVGTLTLTLILTLILTLTLRYYEGVNGGNYARAAIKGCLKYGAGWKPVCDSWDCKDDDKAIYLGQYQGNFLTDASTWRTMDEVSDV